MTTYQNLIAGNWFESPLANSRSVFETDIKSIQNDLEEVVCFVTQYMFYNNNELKNNHQAFLGGTLEFF